MVKFIDLFAGIGGLRLGLENSLRKNEIEHKCVFSSEIDKYSRATYEENFVEAPGHIFNNDINSFCVNEIPDHDVLLAGFPCQPFSQAGLGKGFEDTRGTLFYNIAKIIKEKRPTYFLLENVRGLLSNNKANKTDEYGETFKTILGVLERELNYNVFWDLLCSKDFGLPQNRKRVYILGSSKDIKFSFPKGNNLKSKVEDIMEEAVGEKYTISDKLWTGFRERKKRNKENGKGFGYGIVEEDSEYTNTISARYYKDGAEILIKQKSGKNPRRLTPREAANLQGFPKSFIIPVSDRQAYRQFGNSVSINVIESIFDKLFSLGAV